MGRTLRTAAEKAWTWNVVGEDAGAWRVLAATVASMLSLTHSSAHLFLTLLPIPPPPASFPQHQSMRMLKSFPSSSHVNIPSTFSSELAPRTPLPVNGSLVLHTSFMDGQPSEVQTTSSLQPPPSSLSQKHSSHHVCQTLDTFYYF